MHSKDSSGDKQMAGTTISHGWRDKGNGSYKNFVHSSSTERQRNYLELALKSYYRAYETAESDEDRSSATKNYGTAAWRLATVLINLNEERSLCEFNLREAISYFSKVWRIDIIRTLLLIALVHCYH